MSSKYISKQLRSEVAKRARSSCEYCLLPAGVVLGKLHVDHIISRKQGGPTISRNLALACARCNLLKGSDISAYLPDHEIIVDLFNARKNIWSEHFQLEPSGLLLPKTDIGKGTIRLIRLNHTTRVQSRKMLIEAGLRITPE